MVFELFRVGTRKSRAGQKVLSSSIIVVRAHKFVKVETFFRNKT